MIKSSELRIGNLLGISYMPKVYGFVAQVESISDSLIQFKHPFSEKPDRVYEDNLNGFLPIGLTNEWFEKFGFEDVGNKNERHYYLRKSVLSVYWDKKDKVRKRWKSTFFDECKLDYVHQLQNFYFSLTGEELTIKQ